MVFTIVFVMVSSPYSQGADLSAPIIVLPISDPLDDAVESYKVVVQVTDDSQVDWVMLRYRTIGDGGEFETLPMTMDRGEGVYSAMIPKSQLKRPGIEYFIEAKDAANNVSQEPFPDQARQIYYANAEEKETPKSNKWWWIAGGALAAGLIATLAQRNDGNESSSASLIIEAPVPSGGESAK